MKKLVPLKNVLHLVAIVTGAIVSALSASGVGGDPAIGAVIGGSLNAIVAYA